MAKARSYAKMRGEFWTGETGRRLRREAPETQVVAAYLAFNRHASAIGIYHLPVALVAIETGRSEESIRRALEVLAEEDYAHYDPEREEVFVVNAAREQIGHELKANDNQCRFVAEELHLVRRSRFVARFLELYGEAFHLPPQVSPFEAPSKPLRSPFEAPPEGGYPPLRSHEQLHEQLHKQLHEQEQQQKHPLRETDVSLRGVGGDLPVLVIPCRKGARTPLDEWPLGRSLLTELEKIYPAMDVLGEIQRSRLWLDSNPEKRKTFDGMKRYVTGWLSRAHDSGKYLRRGPALVGSERFPDASRRPKVGDIDRSGKFRYDGDDWQPVTKAPPGGDAA